ncbi:hypothetical protein [Oceanicoccus sp. KOV_DT_Chl]|uniref:hypothetical protein n=1 Tax=Oceanicoccus sp. KOV_DT_Chl TaxID=1904639 RepID=UPI000C79D304|nr:hypothetical protein [Oceanicoccus sp. KOV_DT_Chl]
MQHLNFYSQLDRAVEPALSARQQVWLLAALVVVMLVSYVALAVSSNGLQNEREQLQRQQASIADTLTVLQARKAKLERESKVDGEIALLQSDIQFRRELLANIDPNSAVLEKGFADHLSGLGRQHIDGMWFTEIQLHNGGRQLALLGQTKAPELVPRYIQKLAHESVFSGHEFRVFRLKVPKQQKHLLEFELRALTESSERSE